MGRYGLGLKFRKSLYSNDVQTHWPNERRIDIAQGTHPERCSRIAYGRMVPQETLSIFVAEWRMPDF